MKRQTATHTETATAMLMHIAKAAFLPFTREGGGGVALVALAIALAACNSGGGSSNNTTKTPGAKEGVTISSLVLQAGDETHDVSISGTTGKATLPYGANTDDLTIDTITISEGATAHFGTEESQGAEATSDTAIPALDENNQFKITVTAKDGTTTNTYTITIETEPNDEAELLSLKLNDGATDYTVDVSADKTGTVQVPHNTDLASLTIGAITISEGATVALADNADATADASISLDDNNQFTITVTAEDGTTTNTYTITITTAPNDEAELLSLKINDGATAHTVGITGNTGEVRDIPQGTTLTIGEITISANATSSPQQGDDITLNNRNEFSIMVTAEDGTTTQTYTINVVFIANENAKITTLRLRADDSVDYTVDIDGTAGEVTLPYGTDIPALQWTIASIAISDGATAALADNTDATADARVSLDDNNQFSITVTAEDGTTTNTYTITIETAPNDKAELLSLKLNDGATDYTVDISADKTGAVHVPHNTDLSSLTIADIALSDNATSSPARNESVSVNSSNEFSITVTAEDTTTTATYTISITIAPSDEAQLIALRIAGKEVEFAGITGKVTLLYGTVLADVTIDSIALSDDATADFGDGTEAKAGATIPALNNKQFTITVTAEDGTTTADYTITIDDTPTLAVTGHYAEQRIGAGDFSKDNLLQIGNVQNGEWKYAISVTGSDENNAALTLPETPQTQTATASDSSFDTNPLTVAEWNMFRDNSNDAYLLTITVKLWKSGQTEPDRGIDFSGIAKEQYLLKSWQDVQAINHDLAGDYTLMHDITFPEPGTDGMTTAGFEPIGQFSGNLYGNNKALRNLYINRPTTDNVGLIAVLGTDASIDSLSLVLHADGIRGNNYVGALVGRNNGSISHSDTSGDVSGSGFTAGTVGGLVGRNEGSISQSHATGDVSSVSNYVGGLVGRNDGSISQSHANGDVSSSFSIVGGLVGQNYGSSTIITNSYASGDVSGDSIVGGLVGQNNGRSTITNSYATGHVDFSYDSFVGGLVGHSDGSNTNSYWDTQTTGQDMSHGSDEILFGKTTTEMQKQATFTDWDFDAIWCINEGNDYPRLRGVGGQDLTNCE